MINVENEESAIAAMLQQQETEEYYNHSDTVIKFVIFSCIQFSRGAITTIFLMGNYYNGSPEVFEKPYIQFVLCFWMSMAALNTIFQVMRVRTLVLYGGTGERDIPWALYTQSEICLCTFVLMTLHTNKFCVYGAHADIDHFIALTVISAALLHSVYIAVPITVHMFNLLIFSSMALYYTYMLAEFGTFKSVLVLVGILHYLLFTNLRSHRNAIRRLKRYEERMAEQTKIVAENNSAEVRTMVSI